MVKLLIIVQILLFSSLNLVQAQNDFIWVRNGGGNYNDRGKAICTDSNGNVYITGIAEQDIIFDQNNLNTGWEDIFVVKYDSNGNVLWAKMAGSNNNQEGGYGICTDNSGNCYVTGIIRGTAYFGNDSITSNGDKDIFIAKYDSNGNVLWARNAGGILDDNANSISLDSMNNLYITGKIYGIAYFDNDSLPDINSGGTDFFIAKYDNNGNFIWAKRAGGNLWDEGFDLDVDKTGNIYATGFFTGNIQFGSYTLTNGGRCPFVVKYDNNGNVLWAKQPSPYTYAQGTAISVFPDGGCIITGYFQSGIYFESNDITSYGDEDIYIARYDIDGNLVWAKHAGSTERDRAFGLTVDNVGSALVTGRFEDTASFDLKTVTSNGFWDVFIAKYDSSGNAMWAVNGGSGADVPMAYEETGYGISLDASNNCYAIGTFKGTASFDPFSITSNGNADVFLTKLNLNNINGMIIKEIKQEFTVFPNPNSGEFYINAKYSYLQNWKISLHDIFGRTVYFEEIKKLNDNGNKINMINYSPGMYILQIAQDNLKISKKIIIE